jgi:hypothetical protein
MLSFVKYVGCYQGIVYQDLAYLCKYSTKKCVHLKYWTLSRHVSCVPKWIIWYYALQLLFDPLKMVFCGPKLLGIFIVI